MKKLITSIVIALGLLSTSCTNAQTPAQSSSGNVTVLTTEAFKTKIVDFDASQEWNFKGDKPAIIDFYADWCGPCKVTAPILESLAEDYKGQIDVYKVNVDNEPQLAALFGIRSIPSILFIPKEGKPQMSVGAMSREDFNEAIKTVLLTK
jgi:thioredoxin